MGGIQAEVDGDAHRRPSRAAVGVQLHSYELRGIADVLDKMRDVGARVESAVIGRHRVTLEWVDGDPQERGSGPYYVITSLAYER